MEDEPEITIENEPNDVSGQGFATGLHGENVQFGPGLVLSASAEENMTLDRGGAGLARAGEDMTVTNAGAGALVAGGDMVIQNGGGQVLVAGGDVELTNGGAQYLIVGDNLTASKSFFGIAIADEMTLNEGSKVLLDTPRAIAFGAAFGAVFALLSILFGKRRKR